VDPYVEHDSLTLLLDLILLKRGVYRHLLYNRGSKPRRATSKAESLDSPSDSDEKYLSRARWIWIIKLGAGLVILDACMYISSSFICIPTLTCFAVIRWTHLREIFYPLPAFKDLSIRKEPGTISQSTYTEDALLIFGRVLFGCLAGLSLRVHTSSDAKCCFRV
jgi:hypothetical protein